MKKCWIWIWLIELFTESEYVGLCKLPNVDLIKTDMWKVWIAIKYSVTRAVIWSPGQMRQSQTGGKPARWTKYILYVEGKTLGVEYVSTFEHNHKRNCLLWKRTTRKWDFFGKGNCRFHLQLRLIQ